MQPIIKGGLYRLLFTGFNFLAGLLVAAISGPEVFGVLSLMIVNAALLHILSGLGTDAAIVWHGSSGLADKHHAFSFVLYSGLLQLSLFLLSAYISWKFTGKYLLSRETDSRYFFIELFYFSGLVLTEKYSSLFYSQHLQVLCNKILSSVTACFVLLFGVSYFFSAGKTTDPVLLFSVMVFAQAFFLLLFFHFYQKPSLKKLNSPLTRSFLRFFDIVFITNTLQFLAYRTDYWLIEYFRSTAELGVYAQAVRFAQLLWLLPNIAAALIYPSLAAADKGFDENRLLQMVRAGLVLSLLLVAGVLSAAAILYGGLISAFKAGFTALAWMLPGYYFFIITLMLAAYFSAKKKLLVNLAGSLICLVIILTGDILLIPAYGIKGAAFSNSAAYTLTTVFNMYIFIKISGKGRKDLLRFSMSDFRLPPKKQR